MKDLVYVTGNKDKFNDGEKNLRNYGYRVVQVNVPMQELQDSSGEIIARHKAKQAYATIKKPLIVNDAIWMIPALNNFPGAFMQYTNDCFTPDDWLRLMSGIEDRRVILREVIVYIDENYEKVFFVDIVGEFLHESRGSSGPSSDKVMSFSGDGMTIATAHDNGSISTGSTQVKTSYDLLGEWLQTIELPATRNIA